MTLNEYVYDRGLHAFVEPITQNLARRFPELAPSVGKLLVIMDTDWHEAGEILTDAQVDEYLAAMSL